MNLTYWLNTAWMAKCRREARAFSRAAHDVATAQAETLRAILHANRESEYGRRLGFARIREPREYQQRVPQSSYDTYAAAIERIAAGEPNVLTAEPVRLLEPTSGTTRGEKLIPYTAALRRQFQRMAAAWIYDLLRNRPALRQGRAYWSISPALGAPRRSPGGIPIGFDDDTAYLGGVEQLLARRLLAVPSSVAKLAPVEKFRYATLLHLLRTRDLALISIWSPTFLEAILAGLEAWTDRLAFDLQAEHADVAAILHAADSTAEKLARIWPRLTLISCWGDAAAALYVPRLRALFPQVEFQPKGLIATEGCVSFPLLGHEGGVLALRSHFFEFQEHEGPSDHDGACRLAGELEQGGRYRVLLTTGGGLYRYAIGDVVEVVGFHHACPMVRFLGRSGGGSDLAGEKLSDAFVQRTLDQALRVCGVAARFALVVPVEGRPPHYRLYLQTEDAAPPRPVAQRLVDTLQTALAENPHYRYAVELGQLAPAELAVLDASGPAAWAVFEQRRIEQGQKPGDIKPTALDAWPGWPPRFAPLVRAAYAAPRSSSSADNPPIA